MASKHYNTGASTLESVRRELALSKRSFARILGVEKNTYRDFIEGRRQTEDYVVDRMLNNLDKYLAERIIRERKEVNQIDRRAEGAAGPAPADRRAEADQDRQR